MIDDRKITSFTDLMAWQASHKLSLLIYKLTQSFPKTEQFGLVSQLRRAAISVTSNIAEGFGRSSQADREHFYTMASGSLYEIKSQLILARDLKYVGKDEFISVADEANTAHKLLNGLLKAHKASKKDSNV